VGCFERRVAGRPEGEVRVELLLEAVDRSLGRFLLGITGPPGAGTAAPAAAANTQRRSGFAVVAPMDGFHLSNEQLDTLHLRNVKGAPETFDVDGFVRLLRRVRHETGSTILWPAFDRSIEATIPDSIAVTPRARLVVVEGNYLLLDRPGWREVRGLLDEVWYVDAPRDVLRERLLARARGGDRTEADAFRHVTESDLLNAELVAATKAAADRLLPGA
jgi:pantothenate kinase